MKICTKCKENKEISNFGVSKKGKDGLRSICKDCHSKSNSEWAQKNKKHVSDYGKKYRERDAKRISAQRAQHFEKNRRQWSEYGKAYRKANPGKTNAKTARRRAAKLKATPKWTTKEHRQQIEDLYIEAAKLTRETGIRHEVDHIMPLQGKNTSGLHVSWNLQILTRSDNRKKSRKIVL